MDLTSKGRRWAIDIYKDQSPNMVIMKSVQCGMTEWLLIRTIRLTMQGISVLYALPTEPVRNDFVNNRLDRLMEAVPSYAAGLNNKIDNKGLKMMFSGVAKFVGSQRRMAFKEFPAQAFIVDELSECEVDNIEFGVDRLAAAKQLGITPIIIKISNPNKTGKDIDFEYAQSDMKRWHIECGECGEIQDIDWYKNVVELKGGVRYGLIDQDVQDDGKGDIKCLCRKCRMPIDRLADGEWIAKYPDREISGYHVSKLFTNQASIRELVAIFQMALTSATKLQRFHNSDLGIPHSGEGDEITVEDLIKCESDYLMPKSNEEYACAGVDVGKVFHIDIVIPNNGRIKQIYSGECKDPDDVVKIFKRYNVGTFVVDSLPETRISKMLIDHCDFAMGYVCWYGGDKSKGVPDNKTRSITVGRTESIDEMVFAFQSGTWELPTNWRSMDGGNFVSHLTAPRREYNHKTKIYKWDEGSKDDHHFMGCNYAYQAIKMSGFGDMNTDIIWLG